MMPPELAGSESREAPSIAPAESATNKVRAASFGRRLAVVIIAIVGCGAAYYVGASLGVRPSARSDPKERIGPLEVATADLDVGDVWEEKAFVHRLPIRNASDDDIEIERFDVGCRLCMRVEPGSIRIGGGQTATVELIFDLTPRSLRDYGSAERPLSNLLAPVIRGYSRPRKSEEEAWSVRGIIKSRVTVDLPALDFGESLVEGQPSLPLRVRATLHQPSSKLVARVDTSKILAQIAPVGSQSDQVDVLVRPRPDLPLGRFESELALDLIGEEGEHFRGATVAVTGTVQPELRLLPARLVLGARPVGSVADEIVVLQAPPGRAVSAARIDIDSPDLQVKPTSVAGIPEGRAFRVVQTFGRTGDQRSAVKFHIREEDRPARVVEVEVTYHGLPPAPPGKSANGGQNK